MKKLIIKTKTHNVQYRMNSVNMGQKQFCKFGSARAQTFNHLSKSNVRLLVQTVPFTTEPTCSP